MKKYLPSKEKLVAALIGYRGNSNPKEVSHEEVRTKQGETSRITDRLPWLTRIVRRSAMKKYLLSKGKLVAALAMAGILALGTLGSAFAASPAQEGGGKQGLFGTVTAKGDNTLTVKTNQGSTVQLAISADTKFQIPRDSDPGLADVAVGSRIAVLAQGQAGAQRAARVMIIPGEPQHQHRALTVVEVSGKTVIAEDAQGKRIEVQLEREASADIKGQLVTFIGARSEQSNRFKANVEVKIGQVVKRLEAQAKKVEAEARVEANAQAKAKKEKDLADLKARLEANMQRHLDLFAEVIAKAPPQSQASLETALQLTLKGYRTALEALGESKGNVETRLHLRTLHGSVEAVNAQANEVTVKSRGDATVRLKLTGDTQILIGEKTGSLSNIAVGDQVKVRYDSESSVAAVIRVQTEAKAHGTIQTVDTAKAQLVIALANGATLTLRLTSNSSIQVNHKKATAAALKANALVEVEYNIKTMEASEVEASTKAEVKGTVKAVDSASGTVTIRTEEGKEITVKVTNATRVDIQGLLFGILGISPGMAIKAEFDLITGEAMELKARVEGRGEGGTRAEDRAHGTIASIDSARGKVTLHLDGGGSLTVRAIGDTEIEFNGQLVALANLQAGARVKLEYNTETLIASEIEARSRPRVQLEAEVHGTIQGLDAAKHTMTVQLRDGSTKELVLNTDTVIRISGQPSAEADLRSCMEVEARFRTDTGGAQRVNTTARLETKAEAHGTIGSIDSAGGKITVNLGGGGTLTVRVTGDTKIGFNGQRVTIANLQVGARVKLEYNTDTLIASEIETRSTPQVQIEAEVHGTIQVLDAAKHSMTVQLRDGSTKEVVLNADTVVRISGRPSAEADLRPGIEVEARFRTDTGAALRINTTAKVETQAEVRGKLKSVNAVTGQLVVETADGKSVVVFLDNTTRITESGQPLALLTLLDITGGAEVKIRLRPGISGTVAEIVEVLGRSGASLDAGTSGRAFAEVRGSGQASVSGGPGNKGKANAEIEVKVNAP